MSGAPMLTLQSLQDELEALQALCPVLLPSVVPQGYDDEDLLGLVATEGKQEEERFRSQLRSLIKNIKEQQHEEEGEEEQRQGPVHGCAVCGAAGVPTCQPHAKADEARALRFTTLPSVSFLQRKIHLQRAGFACGSCRALQDPGRFLIFAAACAQSSAPTALQRERHTLAASLALHLAAVNGAPEQLQSNADALLVWAHEVMARAHALRVLASNVEGWQLVGPSDQVVTQATPGLALSLLRALLLGKKKKKQASDAKRKSTTTPGSNGTPAAPAPAATERGASVESKGEKARRPAADEVEEAEGGPREARPAHANGHGLAAAADGHRKEPQRAQPGATGAVAWGGGGGQPGGLKTKAGGAQQAALRKQQQVQVQVQQQVQQSKRPRKQ